MLIELLTLPSPDLLAVGPLPAVTIPDVDPDMDSPFAEAMWRLVAIVLGVAFGLALLATVVAVGMMTIRSLPANVRETGASALGWCIGAMVILGSLTGLAAWAVNFQIF